MFKRLTIGLTIISFFAILLPEVDAATCVKWAKIGGKNVCVLYRSGSVVAELEGPYDPGGDSIVGTDYTVEVVGPECELNGIAYCTPIEETKVEVFTGTTNVTAESASLSQPCPGANAAKVLVIDNTSFSFKEVKKGPGNLGPLPDFDEATLHTFKEGSAAWFGLTALPEDWTEGGLDVDTALRNNFVGYQVNGNWKIDGGFGKGNDDIKKFFDKVPMKSLGDADLKELVGQKVCGVVYDGDIYEEPRRPKGKKSGKRAGLIAFEVLGPVGNGDFSSMNIRPLNAAVECGGQQLYIDVPVGIGEECIAETSIPISTSPALEVSGTFSIDNCSDGTCTEEAVLEIPPQDQTGLCPPGTQFVSFVPEAFYARTTVFADSPTGGSYYVRDDEVEVDANQNVVIEEYCEQSEGLFYNCALLEGSVDASSPDFPVCEPEACPANYPYNISNWQGFLYTDDNQAIFSNVGDCEEVTTGNPFATGRWAITPIAKEAGYQIALQQPGFEEPLFTTLNCGQFGFDRTVESGLGISLDFTEVEGGSSTFSLPLSGTTLPTAFKVCRAQTVSKALDWLSEDFKVYNDDYLLFLNDSGSDTDFDDLIVRFRRLE